VAGFEDEDKRERSLSASLPTFAKSAKVGHPPGVCRNVAKGIQVNYSNNQERNASEVAASTVEINCLEMRSKKPSAITARRTSSSIKRRWRIIGGTLSKTKTLSRLALILALLVLPTGGQERIERGGIQLKVGSLQPLRLEITLRSGANKRVTIDKSQLPWATRYGMVLAAAKSDSETLEKVLPVEDPARKQIFVAPGQTLTGTLDLDGIFKGLDEAREKSDVHLFWAYQAPPELNIGRWSGGWILLPQSKTK